MRKLFTAFEPLRNFRFGEVVGKFDLSKRCADLQKNVNALDRMSDSCHQRKAFRIGRLEHMPVRLARICLVNPLHFFLSIRSIVRRSSPEDVRKANLPSDDGQSILVFVSSAGLLGEAFGCWAQTVAGRAAKLTRQRE